MPDSIPHSRQQSCSSCGRLKDDYKRDVIFVCRDKRGDERSCPEPAVAKFDTGCEQFNLISKKFVEATLDYRLGDFEPLHTTGEDQLETRDGPPNRRDRSVWKACKWRLHRLYRKLTVKGPLPKLVTVDGQPIKEVGILKNTRWRGINLDPSARGQMIKFPDMFIRDAPHNVFRVVENLKYDVVFGLPTIHELQHKTPFECHDVAAGVVVQPPNDPADRDVHEKEKRKLFKLKKSREKEKKEAGQKEAAKQDEAKK